MPRTWRSTARGPAAAATAVPSRSSTVSTRDDRREGANGANGANGAAGGADTFGARVLRDVTLRVWAELGRAQLPVGRAAAIGDSGH